MVSIIYIVCDHTTTRVQYIFAFEMSTVLLRSGVPASDVRDADY